MNGVIRSEYSSRLFIFRAISIITNFGRFLFCPTIHSHLIVHNWYDTKQTYFYPIPTLEIFKVFCKTTNKKLWPGDKCTLTDNSMIRCNNIYKNDKNMDI